MKTAESQRIPIIKNALNAGHIVQALGEINIFANEPLKMHEYEIIDRLIYENKEKLIEYVGREPIKVAVLGGYTTRYICKALNVMMLAEGLFVNIYESEYNLYKQEVLNSESGLYRFKPEIVLFATGSMNIHQFPSPGETADTVTLKAKNIIQEYEQLWTITRERTNAQIIQNNFVPLEQQVLGRLEGRYPWSQNQFISQINTLLWKFEGKDTRILDVCELATRIGLNNWYDPRLYHHGKIGFNPQYLFDYCRIFIRLYRAVTGSTKKCLVTDLDNTLWGGIIGDDGLEGIELGNVSAKGEAYEAFCC
jgi:predicted enzyme involved in methoxymalonyl-ACP biosynthesis